jgi:hypothetical protein
MFRLRAAKVGIFVAILFLLTGCAQPGWMYTDHQELRAAMTKAGQNCGPLVDNEETWPSFDCTSAANDGYVVVYENYEELAYAVYAYCRESYAEFDQNDWITSAGYFVRSGSSIIATLRKNLEYDFYSAQAFCFEV